MKAAVVSLVANTAPVAFGAMGTPVVTLAQITGLPLDDVASVVGRQTPLPALLVPLILVFLVDGRRGLRETWLPALVCGVAFAAAQFAASNYVSAQLADIAAALVGAAALMAVPGVRRPAEEPVRTTVLTGVRSEDLDHEDPHREVLRAYAPYALIVAVFSVAQIPPAKELLAEATRVFDWPFLAVANPAGKPIGANLFTLPAIATLVLLAGLATTVVLRVRPRDAAREWAGTVHELRYAILTVTSVLALAYVMNLSGQAATIGQFVAAAGAGLAFLSPVLGWFGVAVSGSDTSANALFGALQVSAARESGLSPELLAAANSSGGVLGKMVSPQNLTIACAAVGLAGREGDLLRKVLPWSLGLLLVMCLIVLAQSTTASGWMLP